MMKTLLVLFFFTLSMNCFAQDYIEAIVESSCQCLDKIPDTTPKEQLQFEIGMCMLNSAMPYKDKLKKNHKIDLDKLSGPEAQTEGGKLGELLGVRLASSCPKIFSRIANEKEGDEKKDEIRTVKGIITKIDSDFFVAFSLKEESGKMSKFYWMEFIDSKVELTSQYKTMSNKVVNVTFKVLELFDPKINEYRPFNIITKLEVLQN